MQSPIRVIRKNLGMTQPEFALAIDVSQGYLSKIENGMIMLPGKAIVKLDEIYVDTGKLSELQRKFVEEKRSELRLRIRAV